jgi:hypothetical protein
MRQGTSELADRARTAAEKIGAELQAGGSLAYAQLAASQLYESLLQELRRTPLSDLAKRDQLAAAIDQCRRAVEAALPAPRRHAARRPAVAPLTAGAQARRTSPPAEHDGQRPWPFRVIEGGLSKNR